MSHEHNENKPVTNQRFWMTLDQKEAPEAFAKTIPGEFTSSPIREGLEKDGLDRRDFLKVMGASAMMASLAGCTRRPVHKIVPYVTNPEEIIPGVPNFYASACPQTGYGLVLRTREGRPIKVDGNSDHPMNRGGLGARGQAAVHDLYDPDRLRAPKIGGVDSDWKTFDAAVGQALASSKGSTYLLTSSILSPTTLALINKYNVKHVMVDSIAMNNVLDGQAQSYGSRVFPRFRLDRADVIVSIGADFLGTWGSVVEYEGQFSAARKLNEKKNTLNKLFVFEGEMSLTGQNADERTAVHPADQMILGLGLAAEVARLTGHSSAELSGFSAAMAAEKTGVPAEKIHAAAEALAKAKGRSLVLADGKGKDGVALQVLANFMNSSLGNEGETVDASIAPSNQFRGSNAELVKLIAAMNAGTVKTLIIQGFNPVYVLPEKMGFKAALAKVANVVYFASHANETSAVAKFVAAESHSFEDWSDVNPQKDLYSVVQPTIQPLWKTKSLLGALLDWAPAVGVKAPANTNDAVKATFQELTKKHGVSQKFQDFWDDLLMSGVFAPGAKARDNKASARSFKGEALKAAVAVAKTLPAKAPFSLLLTSSIAMADGSQANNALLQELPDPVSKNVWGNYLAVSSIDAKAKGWEEGDVLAVEADGNRFELPLYIQPGMKAGVVAAHLGYGRVFNGRNGNGVGVRLANFLAGDQTLVSDVKITKTGAKSPVACTQRHHSLEGRDIIFDTTLEEYKKNPSAGVEHSDNEVPPTIWSEHEYLGYKWGMVIDLNACTGCSACVIACSVENNVPAVGKDQVLKGREMHWLRLDRYYSGEAENPETTSQAMLCQHCDNAPCETVCPVLATVHSSEGLNQMIYNRCVGTKYCSNNCPYKVRRFNWYNNNGDMNSLMEHPLALSKNPEVTLRSRGVMEKCTFCVQRIEYGKSEAKTAGRRANDEDVKTACQEACAADAIVFGDVNNPESKVSKLKNSPRGFLSLNEVNARPAVTYLTKVRNRAPEKTEKA